MSHTDFESAFEYASATIELLRQNHIAPHPINYELIYTYVSGANPRLNLRLNEFFKSGGAPTEELIEALHAEFMRSDTDDRLTNVSERMQDRITAMFSAIDTAMVHAAAYGETLETASSRLARPIEAEALLALSLKLFDKTQTMERINHDLESQLGTSRDDLATLQQDLDFVRQQSLLDPLTRIANRKCFDESLKLAIAEAEEQHTPLSLVMIDIDHFKSFNDAHGHQTGDQVLRLVAMTLKANVKGKDLAARYGGEEFVLILPQTDIDGALFVANAIREAIQSKELVKRSTREKLGRITASFGVATLSAREGQSALIDRADRCLYRAKSSGRNLVVDERHLLSGHDAA